MKALLPLSLLLFIFISCEENEKPATTTTPIKVDTNTIVNKPTANPYVAQDLSPVDISYFPADYPVQKMTEISAPLPVARVIYSRPHKQGRKIFGALIKYGDNWRLGANEATELELFRDVTIQGKKVNKGRYILYCKPQENTWTIIFNTNLYSWGLKPEPVKDVYKFEIPVERTQTSVEYFTMVFQPSENGAGLLMAWDDVKAVLPFTFQ